MNRRVLACAAAIVAVVIAAAWAIATSESPRPGSDPRRYRPDASGARARAQAACAEFERFVEIVERNGAADEALDALDGFERDAGRAYERDVVWVRLLSASKALKAGFRDDDSRTVQVGLDVARAECRR